MVCQESITGKYDHYLDCLYFIKMYTVVPISKYEAIKIKINEAKEKVNQILEMYGSFENLKRERSKYL